jgi:hypothetical protein
VSSSPAPSDRHAHVAAQGHEPTETLDEFMLRMEGVKAPNSIKRIAWGTGKSIQEVVDDIASMDVSKPTAIGGLDAEGN